MSAEATSTWRTPRFHNVGDSFTGLLLKGVITRQKIKFGTNDPEFWDEEKERPRMEHLYDFILVDEAPYEPKTCHFCKKIAGNRAAKGLDPSSLGEDNGARRIYASDKQHFAIQAAFRLVANLELYGPLTLRYDADDFKNKKPNQDAPKIWVAEYRIPTDAEVDQCDAFIGPQPEQEKTQEEINAEVGDLLDDEPLTLAQMKALSK
jgi:hypothetical protein